jgi:RNA polymerase sigma factor (sigma-70 family)
MITGTQHTLLLELRQPDIEKPVRELYDYYFEGIVAQICANGGTREDGADIFQDAVLALIEKVKTGQFRGDSSIKTFLSAIARNLWLFEIRTRQRRKKRESSYMNGEATSTELHENIFAKDNKTGLQEALAEIGAVCKKILIGFYYEDKSMRDMLTSFDYENEQVLRNKKSKCMKKLKEIIQSNNILLQSLKSTSLYEY